MLLRSTLTTIAALASSANAWLPMDEASRAVGKRSLSLFESNKRSLPSDKIRGINLGSMFIFEKWIDWKEWADMGCDGNDSEFDCVMNTGQERSDKAFQDHWANYINDKDLDEMISYGLNTIRVPLGYWLKEDLVDKSEHFPKGGIDAVTKFVGQASEKGMYIIIDFHGAPGAQEPNQPFTGQKAPSAGFYNDYNYDRAIQWLEWMTENIHTKDEYRNVGMLELVNEPLTWDNQEDSLRNTYYPKALKAIRKVEDDLKVTAEDRLHIQMMGSLWGSGNPTEFLDDTSNTAFDDHRYMKYDSSVDVNKDAYIKASCQDDRNADGPTIVGEWSLSVPDDVEKSDEWKPEDNKDFYTKWFAAQVHAYEKYTLGWVFWTWKANLGDYRWSYKDAVEAGVIPQDLNSLQSVC